MVDGAGPNNNGVFGHKRKKGTNERKKSLDHFTEKVVKKRAEKSIKLIGTNEKQRGSYVQCLTSSRANFA